MVDRNWEDVEEDVSGRMAYCSEGCFVEDCKRESDAFQENRRLEPPYVVGDAASETKLLSMLKGLNPYIAHSIEEEEVDSFSGNWHYIWVPDLEDLRAFGEEVAQEGQDITEAMAGIDYSEWEEFIMFTHPVKGIALIQAWNQLQSRSISVYVSKGKVEMDVNPSNPNLIQK